MLPLPSPACRRIVLLSALVGMFVVAPAGVAHAAPEPETTITGGPANGATVTTRPTYTFTSPDTDIDHFECRIDAADWATCTSPYTAPASTEVGTHTFYVAAADTEGYTDQSPAARVFNLQLSNGEPPDTQITSGPANGATVSTPPTYSFSSPSANVDHFECRVDAADWATCTSPYTVPASTPVGTHTFYVAAADATGFADQSPSSRTFTLQTGTTPTSPDTVITGGPADGATVTTPPTYTFSSPSPGVDHYQCRIDSGAWSTCTSPFTVPASTGIHVFYVAATNTSGLTDGSPASRGYTLEDQGLPTPPNTTITGGPADGSVVSTPPVYSFDSPDTDIDHFECRVDAAEWATCTSPSAVPSSIGAGTHTFYVAATDSEGYTDESPAARTFTYQPPPSQECLDARAQLHAAKAKLRAAIANGAPDRKIQRLRARVRALKALVASVC